MVNVDQNWRLDCNKKSRHSEAVLVSGRSIDTVSSTPPPPLPLPFQWPGLSLWQVPPYFLSIISPPFAHPHGPACHCGRSCLSTHFPHSLPSHLYTQPSVIPTSKARPFSALVERDRKLYSSAQGSLLVFTDFLT